jgi:hypothetical protein
MGRRGVKSKNGSIKREMTNFVCITIGLNRLYHYQGLSWWEWGKVGEELDMVL